MNELAELLPRKVFKCPLCEWQHVERVSKVDAGTLAGVFGLGTMAVIDNNRIIEENEKALKDHFATHETVEWLRKVTALEHELKLLKGTFP